MQNVYNAEGLKLPECPYYKLVPKDRAGKRDLAGGEQAEGHV